MSADIHNLDNVRNTVDPKYKTLIAEIRSCVNDELSVLLSRMFDSADDILFMLAEKAESNEDQTRYFDTMRLLRLERKNIASHFAGALREYMQPAKAEQASDELDDELSLVDQDEMEEMVAISTMHSKAMNSFGESVNHLEARLEVLSMKVPGIIDKQALLPRNICDAFKQALVNVEISIKNKLIIYKLFDQQVCSQLADMYQSLNKLLVKHDILPQIKLDKQSGKPQSPTSQPMAPEESTPAPAASNTQRTGSGRSISGSGYASGPATGGAHGNSAPVGSDTGGSSAAAGGTVGGAGTGGSGQAAGMEGEISRVVQQFISGPMTAQGPGIPSSFAVSTQKSGENKTQYYDRRDVLRALSNIQANLIQQHEFTEFVDAETIKRALMIDMGSRHGGTLTKRVNQIDEKTIDFIEMLFEVIVEDNSISEIITNLLLRLQIPVIKVAMLDQAFFASASHPARRVLNLVCEAGNGISDRENETYIKLETIIDKLLEEFDVDVVSFQLAVDQLNQLINEESQLIEENEKQTQKQALHEHARQMVLIEMQHQVANRNLPKAVHPLVLKHWSTLMFQRYIRHGKDSDEWNQATAILKQLLNSLQPIATHTQWLYVNRSYEQIVSSIKEQLNDTHQNQVNIDESIKALVSTYETMLRESEYQPQLDPALVPDENIVFADTGSFEEPFIQESANDESSPLDEQTQEARQKLADLPDSVRPGVWFQIFDGEDRPVRRLKLSVIIMEEARLIFVDRLGKKVLEKDAEQFTRELSEGQSEVIADHSVFDHALSQVIQSLSAAG